MGYPHRKAVGPLRFASGSRLLFGLLAFCALLSGLSGCAGARLPLPSTLAPTIGPTSSPPAAASSPASSPSLTPSPELQALQELLDHRGSFESDSQQFAKAMDADVKKKDWLAWADEVFAYDGRVERELAWLSAHPPSPCYKPLWDAIQLQTDTLHILLIYQATQTANEYGTGVRHPYSTDPETLPKRIDEATTELQKSGVQIQKLTVSTLCP